MNRYSYARGGRRAASPPRAPAAPGAIIAAGAVLALACAASTGLHAAPPVDMPPSDAQHAQDADLAQARSEADTAFAQAMKALAQQQWLEAELLLERALMFYPAHAEALLQLALLLAQRDDPASAQALIHILLDDPATPPQHHRRLQALLDGARPAAAQAALPPLPPRTVVGWGLAYSANPLAASDARQLVLTLPQGNITIPLQQRSNAGATGQAQLYHRWDQGLELQAAAQASSASGAHPAQRLTLMAPLAQVLQRPWYASLSLQQALDGSRRNAASLHWLARPDPQAPADTQPTLYGLGLFEEPSSGRSGWSLRAQKTLPAGTTGPRTLAWVEYEHARGPSPNALRLGLQGQWPLAAGWQLQGYGYAQADSTGYSPLLENNTPRRIATAYLALEKQLGPAFWGGQLSLTLHWSRRWSNLPLFAWQDRGLGLNWQRQWR